MEEENRSMLVFSPLYFWTERSGSVIHFLTTGVGFGSTVIC